MREDRTHLEVAVVGIGCRFPEADDAESFWSHLAAGRALFSEVPRDRWDHRAFFSKSQRDTDKTWTPSGGFIRDTRSFAALHYGIPPRRLEVMDPQQRLLIETVREAIQDAGYEVRGFDRTRTGVFAGVSVNEYKNLNLARVTAMMLASGHFGRAAGTQELRDAVLEMTSNLAPTRAFSIAGNLTNMAAASVSQTFDFTGPSYTLDAACAAGSAAVYDAILHLRSGLIDVAMAGGAYLNLTPDNLVGFTRVGAISPTGACRPFDARADGFVQGDGVAMLMLKRLGDAVRDGDRIYGVIRGMGCNNDGRGEGPMTPRVEGQLDVLGKAYRDAAISPATVAYFEAHGTGTRVGDPTEVEALGRLLTSAGVDREDRRPLGSVKGNVGHTMSCAGVASLIKALKIVQHRFAPPLAGFERPHPELPFDRWPLDPGGAARPLEGVAGNPLRVGASAFGFGGTNVHFVVEESPEARVSRRARAPETPQAILVSAPTFPLLQRFAASLVDALARDGGAPLAAWAYTLSATRTLERYRAVLAVRSRDELAAALRTLSSAGDELPTAAAPRKLGPAITVFDRGEHVAEAPVVAFLFPGQGAQRVGLLEDWRARFPAFSEALRTLAAGADGILPRPLTSYLYPETRDPAAEAALTATSVCQPALAALGLAAAALLRSAGVEPAVSLGHSLGEFTAMASGGMISGPELVGFVARRGLAMEALALPDPGAMAAVTAPAAEVARVLEGLDGVVLANTNHPRQVSISGTTAAVQAASERLRAARLGVQALSVSHAFHSPLLDGLRPAMEPLVSGLPLSTPAHGVASCIDAAPHGADLAASRDLMLRHATAPVDFVRGLGQARAAGATVFVQLGAGSMLASFARATLGAEVTTLGTAPMEPDDGLELVRTVATLRALGVPARYEALLPEDARVPLSLPFTPLEREAYWIIKDEPQLNATLVHPFLEPGEGFGVVELEMSKKTETVAPVAPVAVGPSAELIALFAQQAALMRAQAEVIAGQNRLLLGEGAPVSMSSGLVSSPVAVASAAAMAPVPAPAPTVAAPAPVTAAPTPAAVAPAVVAAPVPAAPAPVAAPAPAAPAPARPAVDPAQIRERVLEVVAKVSAFPRAAVKPEQRLIDELGFDSLMVADLSKSLDQAFPTLGGLPASLFAQRTTVDELATHIARALTEDRPKPAPATTTEPLSLYREQLSPRALGADLAPIDGRRWVIVEQASRGALARDLAGALSTLGAQVTRVELVPEPLAPAASLEIGAHHLWSLASLDALSHALERLAPAGLLFLPEAEPTTLGSSARTLHALARRARRGVLAALLGAHADHAGVASWLRSVARERPQTTVRALTVDDGHADLDAIVRELRGAERTVDVTLSTGERRIPTLRPEAIQPGRLDPATVALISGGAGELGAKVARALAVRRLRGLILVGRRPSDAAVEALLAELGRLGTPARYVSADLARPHTLPAMETHFGPVTLVVHAAGLIEDQAADKKSLESFDRVSGAKLDAARSLRAALPDLRRWVTFSSWAAHFGNAGQADYAAANGVLDRLAEQDGSLSIDWAPWTTSAMVKTIPAPIQQAMREAGVTFIDDDEGVELAVALIASPLTGKILVGRGLPQRTLRQEQTQTLSLETYPYLADHVLRGAPVLPLAAATDLLAQAAVDATGQASGLVLESLELLKGVSADRERALELRVEGTERDGATEAKLELWQDRELAYRARYRHDPAARPTQLSPDGAPEALPFDVARFYGELTFHGPRLQGIDAIEQLTARGIVGRVHGAPSVQSLMPHSARPSFVLDPVLLDSAFQLAGYWAIVHHQRAGYPIGFRRLVLHAPVTGRDVRATIVLVEAEGDRFVGDLSLAAADGTLLASIEGLEGRFADTVELRTKSQPMALDVPRETYDPSSFPEVEMLDQRLQMAELIGLKNPYFALHLGTARNRSNVDGVEMINFSSYNYLGFSGHPEVISAAQRAIERYGTSVSASRVASGERPIHRELERAIASHVGVDDSVVLVSGHATNVTTLGTLVGTEDIVLHDALAHESILSGIKQSHAARRPFPHQDLDALERSLAAVRGHYRRALIAVEGIYSMDGDICELPRLIELKKRYGCLLMVDEAHSIGVLGHQGRGVGHHFPGVNPRDVDVWMGTLSKSFSSCGGYIAGSAALVRLLKYSAGGFVYSAGITPPNAAAALRSLELMTEHPEVVERLRANSRLFLEACRARGLNTGMATGNAVVPVIVGNSLDALKLSAALARRKINVNPIVYPAVEDDASRLRFFISSTHTEDELTFTAEAVAEELARIRRGEDESPATAQV